MGHNMDSSSIPIIDISQWRSRDPLEVEHLIHCVFEACTKVGFFYIKNHGIADEVIEQAHGASKRFFALPEAIKLDYFKGKSKNYRSFSPLLAEQSTGADIDDVGERAAQACFSESFDIGYEVEDDSTEGADGSLPLHGLGPQSDNQWPVETVCPGFRRDFLRYFAAGLGVCRDLMQIFASSLGLQGDFFDNKMKHPKAMARMLHYPPQPVKGETLAGLKAHTDYDCVTILWQGNVPALEVLNRSGQWVRADPIPGTLVVNIGDSLALWTNNRFKSTIHRVSNLTGKERHSLPISCGVDRDVTISVLNGCITEESPACTAPFKASEYVQQKLSRAHVKYGATPPDSEVLERIRTSYFAAHQDSIDNETTELNYSRRIGV